MKYINENPTKTEKILFEKYGLYLIYKDEDSYRYAPIHIENQYVCVAYTIKETPSEFLFIIRKGSIRFTKRNWI